MNFIESIRLALLSIRDNKLKSGLTLLSISIGIFTIIAVGTLVSSLDNTITNQLSSLGENKFVIQKTPAIQMGGSSWRKYRNRKPITYSQAKQFKKMMQTTESVTIFNQENNERIKFREDETDPDVAIVGADENFLNIQKYTISKGRFFVEQELAMNQKVCVLGNDVVVDLFGSISPLGKTIKVRNKKFTVIGVTDAKGSMMGQSMDNYVIIPILDHISIFSNRWNESLGIAVEAYNHDELLYVQDEAIGILRTLRNCKPWEDNDFEIITNEAITEQFSSLTKYITIFGLIIGIIALIAAGVGIMNIMLSSVSERTREIGVRKAVGAKRSIILTQFIIEAITLSQIGGLIGILLGVLFAVIIGSIGGLGFTLPIFWVVLSLVFCTLMGLFFGAYPAWKASKLDPIDALRYE